MFLHNNLDSFCEYLFSSFFLIIPIFLCFSLFIYMAEIRLIILVIRLHFLCLDVFPISQNAGLNVDEFRVMAYSKGSMLASQEFPKLSN